MGESGESTVPEFPTISRLMDLAVSVDQVYTPCLCIFGTFGNCLSILVFYTRYHKTRGSLCFSLYLSVLALSDTGFLLSLFLIWLQNMGIDLLNNDFSCPAIMYLGQVTGFLSVWFIVSFTVERFFAVCYPLSPSTRCTLSRAKKIIAGLTLFALVAFSYVFVIAQVISISTVNNSVVSTTPSEDILITYVDSKNESIISNRTIPFSDVSLSELSSSSRGECETDGLQQGTEDFLSRNCTTRPVHEIGMLEEYSDSSSSPLNDTILRCSVPQKYFKFMEVINYIDSAVTFLIPFLIISVLNIRIMCCVKKFRRSRESMLASNASMREPRRRNREIGNSPSPNPMRPRLKDILGYQSSQTRERGENSIAFFHRKTPKSEQVRSKNPRGPVTNIIRCCKCQQEKHSESSGSGNETCLKTQRKDNRIPNTTESGSKSSIESEECGPGATSTNGFSAIRMLCNRNQISYQRSTIMNNSSSEMRVTKTLLLVSSVFVILNFPSHSIRIATFIQAQFEGTEDVMNKLFVAQHWANFLFNTNFAVNFLLYCYSGKTFRHALKNLLFSNQTSPNPQRYGTTSATTQVALNTVDQGVRRCENNRRWSKRFSSFSRYAEDAV